MERDIGPWLTRGIRWYSITTFIARFLTIKDQKFKLCNDCQMNVQFNLGTREVVDRQISAMDNGDVGLECYFMLALTFK